MLTRPAAAAVILVLLFCGATVGLEAVGLLFHAGVPDPQQRIEAFVSRLEADLSPVDLPTEPVEAPLKLAEELPRSDSERVTAAQPVQDVDDAGKVAEIPDRAEQEGGSDDRLTVAFSSTAPNPGPAMVDEPDEIAAPVLPESPSESNPPAPYPALPAVQASGEAPVATRPTRRTTGSRRLRPTQSTATGYAAFGWPVLDWLTL
jgi:hypothetical protein